MHGLEHLDALCCRVGVPRVVITQQQRPGRDLATCRRLLLRGPAVRPIEAVRDEGAAAQAAFLERPARTLVGAPLCQAGLESQLLQS